MKGWRTNTKRNPRRQMVSSIFEMYSPDLQDPEVEDQAKVRELLLRKMQVFLDRAIHSMGKNDYEETRFNVGDLLGTGQQVYDLLKVMMRKYQNM